MYPGACSRYVDTNNNGICDHSEPAPTASASTAPATTATSAANAASTATPTTAGSPAPSTTTSAASGPAPSDGSDTESGVTSLADSGDGTTGGGTAGSAGNAVSGVVAAAGLPGVALEAVSPPAASRPTTEYYFGPVTELLLVVYGLSFALYRTRRIRLATHRRIWNLMLLGTFLVTGGLGALLTIRLNYGLAFDLPFSMLFWHVEAGIAMTVISVFHVAWHARYYAACLSPSRRRARACAADARRARPSRGDLAGSPSLREGVPEGVPAVSARRFPGHPRGDNL